jgi:NADH-quinone oxidoreductase subunit L
VLFVNPSKKLDHFFGNKEIKDLLIGFGPDGISKLIKKLSNKAGLFQTGFIYDYAFVNVNWINDITYLFNC